MLRNDRTWICWPHRIGYNILLCGRKQSYFPFHLLVRQRSEILLHLSLKVGPDWSTFLQTFLEISGVSIVFIIFVSEKISRILTIFTICLLTINLLSFTITACSDPGIVFHPLRSSNDLESGNSSSSSRSNILTQEMTLECAQCHVRRPTTARHCYKCGVCVDKVSQ
jgi:hypothetical protein